MARATNLRDQSHARIYRSWILLPAWRSLTPIARVALVTILARYHPDSNNLVRVSVRDLAELVGCSKTTAGEALAQLEDRQWLAPHSRGRLGPNRPSEYLLAMYEDPLTGEPPTYAFRQWEPLLRSERPKLRPEPNCGRPQRTTAQEVR